MMRYIIVIIILIIYRASLVQEQDQGEEWNVRYPILLFYMNSFACTPTYVCIVDIPVPYLPSQYSVMGFGTVR
jgi:hypothetical protein